LNLSSRGDWTWLLCCRRKWDPTQGLKPPLPLPLSSEAEERGITSSGGTPGGARRLSYPELLSEPPGFYRWREEYTRSMEPARALAVETLTLERKLKAEG